MFCATVIPTINRPTLARAVHSVLDQEFDRDEFEVIVVNDSGEPLAPAPWQDDPRVQVVHTNRRERCVARNTGAALARARYLHFLDDDDLVLPGAFEHLWSCAQRTGAEWVYGGYQSVDDQGELVREFCPEVQGNAFALLVAGESIPFQASLLKTETFFAAGGFDPTIPMAEDRDVGRRMALRGSLACVPVVVARIRTGELGSSLRGRWTFVRGYDLRARDLALSQPQAFARIMAAAPSSYWRGRVSRAYCGSAVWNLEQRRWRAAFSRIVFGVAVAGIHPLNPNFWRGLGTRVR